MRAPFGSRSLAQLILGGEAKPLCDTNSNRKYTLRQHNNSSSSSLAEVYDDFGTFTPTPSVRRFLLVVVVVVDVTQRKTFFGFVCPTQTPLTLGTTIRRYFDSTPTSFVVDHYCENESKCALHILYLDCLDVHSNICEGLMGKSAILHFAVPCTI